MSTSRFCNHPSKPVPNEGCKTDPKLGTLTHPFSFWGPRNRETGPTSKPVRFPRRRFGSVRPSSPPHEPGGAGGAEAHQAVGGRQSHRGVAVQQRLGHVACRVADARRKVESWLHWCGSASFWGANQTFWAGFKGNQEDTKSKISIFRESEGCSKAYPVSHVAMAPRRGSLQEETDPPNRCQIVGRAYVAQSCINHAPQSV